MFKLDTPSCSSLLHGRIHPMWRSTMPAKCSVKVTHPVQTSTFPARHKESHKQSVLQAFRAKHFLSSKPPYAPDLNASYSFKPIGYRAFQRAFQLRSFTVLNDSKKNALRAARPPRTLDIGIALQVRTSMDKTRTVWTHL